MSGFVYIWRDRKTKRYYIGCHLGPEDDGYICSSQWMLRAYGHRPEDFKKKILSRNIPKEQLLDEEYRWLKQIKPEELKTRYYNLNNHHFGHWTYNKEQEQLSIRQKISEAQKGKRHSPNTEFKKGNAAPPTAFKKGHKETEEVKLKRTRGCKDRKMSEEAKQKIREARAKQIFSEETRKKMSESQKQRFMNK